MHHKADEKLCVITLSEKTENDMTSWSASVEEEREQLLEHVSVCVCVCVCVCVHNCTQSLEES